MLATQDEREFGMNSVYIVIMSLGSANLQLILAKILLNAYVPFPLQCGDVSAKLRGYNSIAKGRGKRKGAELSKVFQGFCLRL